MFMNIWNAMGPCVNEAQKVHMSHRLVKDGIVAVLIEVDEMATGATASEVGEKVYAEFTSTLLDAATATGILEDIYTEEQAIKGCGVILLHDGQIIVATAGDCVSYEARGSALTRLCDDDASTVEAVAIPGNLESRTAYLLTSKGFEDRVRPMEITIDYCKSKEPKQWVDYIMLRAAKRHKDSDRNYAVFAIMAE